MYHGERFNSISHLVGAGLALTGAIVLITIAARLGDPWKIVSFSIYGAMLVALYVLSTVYHSVRGRAKAILRKLDHCAIYMLIAGTYTPFALVSLRGTWGWWLLGIVWSLALFGIGRYTGSQVSTKLKVTGIDLFSAGDFFGGKDSEEIILNDAAGGVYKKLVIQDNKLVGGVLYGDTADGPWYYQLLRDGQDIHEIRDHLLFGQSHVGDVGHQGHSKAAAMADSAEVCGCNGVSKGTIVRAIKENGLFTLDDIKKHTKASSSCGSCAGLCEQILSATIGGAYTPAASNRKPVCGCTDFSHQEVRDAIRQQPLLSIGETMRFL